MKALIKNISIYSLGGILNKSIQFLLLPLYTRVLVPADYGKLELIYVIGSILAIFNGLLVQNAYSRFYFDNEDSKYRKLLYSTSLYFMLICSVFTFAGAYIFSDEIANLVFDFSKGGKYVVLIGASSLLFALASVPEKTLFIQQKAKLYTILNILDLFITIGFTVYFVLVLKWNVEGVLWGQIVGRAARFIMMFAASLELITFGFSITYLRALLAFSIFLIPSKLASFITYMSNRYFLQEYTSLEDVGLFSLGYKIASIIPILLTQPVKHAFGPYIYNQLSDINKSKSEFSAFIRLYFIGILIFAFILSLFSKEIIFLIADKSYLEGYTVVFILSLSYVLIGLAGIVVIGINIVKKTWTISLAWLIGAIVNIVSNILLIPPYGKFGATIATIFTFLVILIIYLIAIQKYYPIKIDYFKMGVLLIITIVFYYLSELIDTTVLLSIIYKILIAGTYLFTIYISGFFSKKELLKFKRILLKK